MTSTGSAPEIVFRGIDGTEAEEFIAALEELAFTEGWHRDRERMLFFARSRLRHKALRWLARLDPSKKNDWDLFVEALFDQYPLVEAPTEAEISTPVWSATTFSSSASTAILPSGQVLDPQPNIDDERNAKGANTPHSKKYDPSFLGKQVGILRIVVENGSTTPLYVWRGRPPFQGSTSFDQLGTTADRREALVVCFILSHEPHPIGCLNAAYKLSDLFLTYIYWTDPPQHVLQLGTGVVAIPKEGVYPPNVSKVWNVALDGSLEASLSGPDPDSESSSGYRRKPEDFKTAEVHLDTSGISLRFVKPDTPLWQDDPKRRTQVNRYDVKARIVFEPL